MAASSKVSQKLWAAALPLASRSLHHPFVLRLASGTLPRASFQGYVAQDAFFLRAFARAYALALSRCSSDEALGELSSLIVGVVDELKLHHGYAREWGIDVVDVRPNGATSAYTDFLLELARSDAPVAVVLAAMTPCMRLYAFLGQRLRAAFPGADHPYAEWLRTYASDDFAALADRLEALLDGCAEGVPLGAMQAAYSRAMQLELDFFAAQPGVEPVGGLLAPGARLLFAVDFDETATVRQTLPLLAELAVAHAGGAAQRGVRAAEWQALSDEFNRQYGEVVAAAVPPLPPPGAAVTDAPAALRALVARLSAFERQSVAAAERARALRGIPQAALSAAGGERVEFRPGFGRLVRALHAARACERAEVLSVNWSAQLVSAALVRELGGSAPGGAAPAGGAAALESALARLHSNEMPVEPAAGGGGGLVTSGALNSADGMHTASDKGALFARLAAESGARSSDGDGSDGHGGGPLTLYAGDSLTDLQALLAADLGVVFGASASLRAALAALGVHLLPLVAARRAAAESALGAADVRWPSGGALGALQAAAGAGREPPTLYAAEGWHELHACLLGDADAHVASAARDAEPRAEFVLPGLVSGAGSGGGGGAEPVGKNVPVVLSIAGSDSGGGAGIQADLKTCAALGVFGTTALAGLTAQNTRGVHAIEGVSVPFLQAQLDAVLGDFTVSAVKTGMLPSAPLIEAVVAALGAARVRHVVVDPVMVAASGDALVGADAMVALCSRLAPLATVLTPNLPEAEAMLGMAAGSIATVEQMRDAATRLHALGCAHVLVKGGHLSAGDVAVDVLYDGVRHEELFALRVATTNSHGTGCTLSTAIAAHLARGCPVREAVLRAKTYLTGALAASASARLGKGLHGPLNHAFQTHSWRAAEPVEAERAARRERVRRAMALYAVTDNALSETRGGVVRAALDALAGGVTCLQLRDKGPAARLLEHAAQLLPAARAVGAPLIINDRVDIACAPPYTLHPSPSPRPDRGVCGGCGSGAIAACSSPRLAGLSLPLRPLRPPPSDSPPGTRLASAQAGGRRRRRARGAERHGREGRARADRPAQDPR